MFLFTQAEDKSKQHFIPFGIGFVKHVYVAPADVAEEINKKSFYKKYFFINALIITLLLIASIYYYNDPIRNYFNLAIVIIAWLISIQTKKEAEKAIPSGVQKLELKESLKFIEFTDAYYRIFLPIVAWIFFVEKVALLFILAPIIIPILITKLALEGGSGLNPGLFPLILLIFLSSFFVIRALQVLYLKTEIASRVKRISWLKIIAVIGIIGIIPWSITTLNDKRQQKLSNVVTPVPKTLLVKNVDGIRSYILHAIAKRYPKNIEHQKAAVQLIRAYQITLKAVEQSSVPMALAAESEVAKAGSCLSDIMGGISARDYKEIKFLRSTFYNTSDLKKAYRRFDYLLSGQAFGRSAGGDEPCEGRTKNLEIAESFHNAVKKGDIKAVQKFIATGVDINLKHNHGWTPLHWAVLLRETDIVALLIKNGADVNARTEGEFWLSRSTPLHFSSHGPIEIVSLLIKNRSNINVGNRYGATPLHMASQKGNLEVIDLLIKNGAYVDVWDKYSRDTPLHMASRRGNLEVINLLIKNGANVNIGNRDGKTPIDLARPEHKKYFLK